jgi:hypothetical protein
VGGKETTTKTRKKAEKAAKRERVGGDEIAGR